MEPQDIACRSATRSKDGATKQTLDEPKNDKTRVILHASGADSDKNEERKRSHIRNVAPETRHFRQGREEEWTDAVTQDVH